MKKAILTVILLVFLKSIIWTTLVPIFETPDEQAHFAQLQWYAEKKSLKIDGTKNLSQEVALAEEILGTRRNIQGVNKYTYHPEFKISYSQNLVGLDEKLINNQPKSTRTTMVGQEAAGYPPLYYQLSLPFYNAVYDQGLIDRLFASRLIGIILNILLVITAYLIGKQVWEKEILPITLAALVGFQPMVSFVSAGIHPDNLLNLVYSLIILVCLLVVKHGLRLRYLVLLAALIYLGFQTKILTVFVLPVVAAVLVYKFFHESKAGIVGGALVLLLPVTAFIFQLPLPYMPITTSASPLGQMNFWQYLQFRGPKILFEIWPWYWGVFKWLGVVLPPLVLKVITRAAILAAIGLTIKLIRDARKKITLEFKFIVFSILSVTTYILYLVLWDWRVMQNNGYSHGLQGRYFFTNIVPQMALFLAGFTFIKRFEKPMVLLLILAMVVLNVIALHTVAKSYYDLSSWQVFLTQVSQYKPQIVKDFVSLL